MFDTPGLTQTFVCLSLWRHSLKNHSSLLNFQVDNFQNYYLRLSTSGSVSQVLLFILMFLTIRKYIYIFFTLRISININELNTVKPVI